MAVRDVGHLRTRLSWEDGGTITSLQRFRQDLRNLRSEMRTVTSQGKEYTNSLAGLKRQQDILNRELRTHQERVKEISRRYDEAVKAKGRDSDEARKLAAQYNNAVAQMQKTEQQLQKVTSAIEEQQNPWRKLREELDKASEKYKSFGDRLTDFGKNYTMKVTAPIVAGGTAMFKAAMDYESAFAGVRKTVDATEEELAQLSKGIREMAKELPASATEIAAVAEAAGQLGIETENILEFTRTMIDLGEATNLTAEQAATQFARFANIVGMSQKDFDRLGSTVVALGNNFATTEAEIVDMGMRLAGAGAQIGLTEAQIMAFATALSSVGIAAEMGGSAFSKVMVDMQLAAEQGGERLKAFAKVAGMSAEEFKKSFEQDATKAISAFLKGLATAEERGKSAIAILDEMDIKEVRLRDTLLRAAGAYDVFNNAVELGNKAWEENTALTAEAEQRYATTESRLKILWNRLKDVAISFGESLAPAIMDALDAAEPFFRKIEEGAKAFSDLDKEQQRSILKIFGFVAAIGPASIAVGTLSKSIGGLLSIGSSLSQLLGNATGGTGLLARIAKFGPGGVVGLAIAGIGLLTTGIMSLTKESKKSVEATFNELEARQKQIEEIDNLINRYEELERKNRLSNDEMLRLLDIQSELDSTSTPSVIEELQKEYDELVKKSGLTNDEMTEFIDLNGKIIDTAPETKQVISETGKAWAETTQAVKDLNKEKLESLKLDAEIAMQDAIKKMNEKLAEQKRLQEEINELNEKKNLYFQKVLDYNKEILAYEQELSGLSIETDYEKIRSLETIISNLKQERKIADELYQTSANDLKIKRERLEKLEEELKDLDAVKWRYEEIVLAQAGITAEREKGLEVINSELRSLELEQQKLDSLYNSGKMLKDEYLEQNKLLDEKRQKLEEAKESLQKMNEYAQETIYKEIVFKEDPISLANEINRRLGLPIYKQLNLRVPSGFSIAPLYADGTNYHPGGPAIVGEEGPELAKLGNRWAMLDFGLWNLPRGTQVIPHDESMKILNAIKRIPAYADGIGSQGTVNRILGQLESQQTVTPKQPAIIQLITPDRRVFAEWLVDDITDMQNFKQARMKLFAT